MVIEEMSWNMGWKHFQKTRTRRRTFKFTEVTVSEHEENKMKLDDWHVRFTVWEKSECVRAAYAEI